MKTQAVFSWCVLLFLALLVAGCGPNDRVAGGECDRDRDCASGSICATGGDFPGGMCTLECDRNSDCPNEMSCIDEEGGVCLFWCDSDRDCFGGYECESEQLRHRNGREDVCIGA